MIGKTVFVMTLAAAGFAAFAAPEHPVTEDAAGMWMPAGIQVTQDVKVGKFAVSSGAIRGNYPSMTLSFTPEDMSAPDAKLKLWVRVNTEARNWNLSLRLYSEDGDGWFFWNCLRQPTQQGAMPWRCIEVPLAQLGKYKNADLKRINRIMILGDKIVGRPRPVTEFFLDGLELTSGGRMLELKQSKTEDTATENPPPGVWTPKAALVPSELSIGKFAVSSGEIVGNYPVFTLRIPETDLSDPELKLAFFAKVVTTGKNWTFSVRFSSLAADGFKGWDSVKSPGDMAWRKFEIPLKSCGLYKNTDMTKTVKIMFVGGRIYDRDKRKHRTEFIIDGMRLEKGGKVIRLFPPEGSSHYRDTPAPVKHPALIYGSGDIERAKANIQRHPWAREMWEKIRKSARFWLDCPEEKLSFWIPEDGGFHVNCPSCRLNETLKPDETFTRLTCSNCQTVFPSEKYPETESDTVTTPTGKTRRLFFYKGQDQFIHRENIGNRYYITALLNFYRLRKLHDLLPLAMLYAVERDPAQAQKVRQVLLRFAAVYPDYPPRFRATAYHYGENLMAGKLFSWKIHDSIMITRLALAYDLTCDSGVYSSADRVAIENGIFREYRELMLSALPEMGDGTRNGTTTHLTAMLYTALLLGEKDLVDLVLNGPQGVKFIRGYFRRDGSSRENSPAYNNMAVRPLSGIIEALNSGGRREDLLDIPVMRLIFRSVARMVMPNGKALPMGDSDEYVSYRLSDAELNCRLFPSEENRRLLNMALGGGGYPTEESLFFRDPDLAFVPDMPLPWYVRESMVLPGKECSILRHGGTVGALPERALALYHNGPVAHGHDDALNIVYYDFHQELLTDLGYLGYTHRYTPFLRSLLAHNTVIVDGAPQNYRRKVRLNFFSGRGPVQSVSADAKQLYPGAEVCRRTLVMVNHAPGTSYVVDAFRVQGGKRHDYLIHAAGEPAFPEWRTVPAAAAEVGGPDIGTNYMFEAAKSPVAGDFTVTWRSDRKEPAVNTAIRFFPDGAAELFRLTLPGLRNRRDPYQKVKMFAAMLRKPGPDNHFLSLIHAYRSSSGITGAERLTVNKPGAAALLVRAGESADLILVDNSGNDREITLECLGEPVKFQGRVGVVELKNSRPRRLYMVGGSHLSFGGAAIDGVPEIDGTVKAVDPAASTLTADVSAPLPATPPGEYLIFPDYPDGAYRLQSVAPDGKFSLHRDELIRVRPGDRFRIYPTVSKSFEE